MKLPSENVIYWLAVSGGGWGGGVWGGWNEMHSLEEAADPASIHFTCLFIETQAIVHRLWHNGILFQLKVKIQPIWRRRKKTSRDFNRRHHRPVTSLGTLLIMERCQTSVSLICSYGGVNTQTLKDRESPCGLYSDTCLWWLSVHCQLLTALRAPLWASPQNTVTITELSKWVIHMSLWWLTPWQLLLIAAWTAAINWLINMKRVLKVMRILIRQSGDGEGPFKTFIWNTFTVTH